MNKFVIIAEARCGYQLLATSLNSNPTVCCYGEVFGRKRVVRRKSLFGMNIPVCQENDSAIGYLENVLLPYAKNKEAVGLKLNHNDCIERENWKDLWSYLVQERWKVIHLQRRNLLDRAISEKLAIKDWNWNFKPYKSPVRITLDELEYYYNRSKERANRIYREFARNDMLDVFYEDLDKQRQPTLEKIQQFIGVEPRHLVSPMIKQRNGGQSTYLINYRHLYSKCIKHPIYKKYLTDILMF